MNLTSPKDVKEWCLANGFRPNKTLGQNFLIDRNTLVAIADAALEGIEPGANIFEVGPGLGVLTEELLKRGCKVTAVEKDRALAARLSGALGEPKGLTVVPGDALAILDKRSLNPSDYAALVSNLPYQAGTRILLELVKARAPRSMTVLVQTEVAERLAAKEGSKARGLAGVWAQLDYDVKIVRKVPATCFWPRPAIGSSVVRLDRHERNSSLSEEERKLFHSLTKRAFGQRRKQLGSIFKDLIQSSARAEELTNDDWITLTKGLIGHEET